MDDVRQAAERIAPYVYQTPSIPSEPCSRCLSCEVFIKAENLQHIGAFKARGATNAVFQLDEQAAARGVVTHSSGNHAAALARAAALRGIPAHVVMPSNSAAVKIEAVRALGVEPQFCEPNAESRQRVAEQLQQQTGATMIHPYDNPSVMAGQGTVALELLQQVENLDVIIVPVGGGGLLSGVLTAAKSIQPNIAVYAAEPSWADDAYRSLRSGRIEQPSRYDTIADGLRSPLGENTFPIIQHLVDDILLVSEEAIEQAKETLLKQVHIVAEPSGTVALAALATSFPLCTGKRVAVVVSGGNIDWPTK